LEQLYHRCVRRKAHDPQLGDYWVQYEPANLVEWGVVWVPETFTAGFEDERYRLRIEIVLEEDGPECVAISRLHDDAPPLTSQRRFPLRAMVNASVRAAAFELIEAPIEQIDPRRENPRLVPDERGYVQVHSPAFDDRGAGRRVAVSEAPDQDLRLVAALYRRAVASGSAPSVVIAGEFRISRTSARKLVQRARQEGLLGAAVGRRAGEARPSRGRTE
jgi:hypothetical protein